MSYLVLNLGILRSWTQFVINTGLPKLFIILLVRIKKMSPFLHGEKVILRQFYVLALVNCVSKLKL